MSKARPSDTPRFRTPIARARFDAFIRVNTRSVPPCYARTGWTGRAVAPFDQRPDVDVVVAADVVQEQRHRQAGPARLREPTSLLHRAALRRKINAVVVVVCQIIGRTTGGGGPQFLLLLLLIIVIVMPRRLENQLRQSAPAIRSPVDHATHRHLFLYIGCSSVSESLSLVTKHTHTHTHTQPDVATINHREAIRVHNVFFCGVFPSLLGRRGPHDRLSSAAGSDADFGRALAHARRPVHHQGQRTVERRAHVRNGQPRSDAVGTARIPGSAGAPRGLSRRPGFLHVPGEQNQNVRHDAPWRATVRVRHGVPLALWQREASVISRSIFNERPLVFSI